MVAESKGPTPDGLTGHRTETYSSGESLDPNLKYDTTGSTPIVLIPQPSDDPNDPLVGPMPSSIRVRLRMSIYVY